MSSVSPDLVKELAPTGTLRAAINIGNPVLVQTDAAGTPSGVTIDLARELARRLGVPLETVVIDGAGKIALNYSGEFDWSFPSIVQGVQSVIEQGRGQE